MARVIGEATHNSSPGMTYYMDAEQIGGSGNQRTIKITLYLKCGGSTSASWYGYPVNWKGRIYNSYSDWTSVKGTESWNGSQGFRSFTWTATVDVGTTASTNITVGFETDSYNGSSNWDLVKTGTFTVDKTNTAPYFTSGEQWVRIRPNGSSSTTYTGYYPENIASLYVDWGYASDNEGGTINYSLNQSVNGGGWSRIDYGTDRAHEFQIGSGNEGQKLQFYVDAVDNGGLWSNKIYSSTITKNTLSGGTVSSVTSINYNSSSFEVTIGAGRNTDGSPVKYRVYSDNITIYNQNDTSDMKHTIQIYKSGTVPTTPYIRFDDIKNYLKSSSYNGKIHIGVKTTNNYGSIKWAGGSVNIDLRTNPNTATGQQISKTTSESTMYRKIASNSNYYFLPDGSKVARVKWSVGSDKLGDAITQELYVAYGSGGWQKLADLSGTTTYYNHAIAKQSSKQQFKYLIRTKTSYGYYTDATTSAENLEYYNNPTISLGVITRTATTAEVRVTIKTNSSMPNIGTTGSWKRYASGTTTPVQQSGSLTSTQNEQTINLSSLTDAGLYDLIVTYNDDSGFASGDQSYKIAISANSPTFFVNKYGAGVNGLKANSDSALIVKGSVFPVSTVDGTTSYTDVPLGLYVTKTEAEVNGFPAGYYSMLGISYNDNRQFQIGANNSGSRISFRSGHVNNTGGTGTGWSAWRHIYHEGFKPSAADVGALSTSGGSVTGEINLSNDKGLSWSANSDGGRIYFHADSPSQYSYIRYQVTDDWDEYHQFGGYHYSNGFKEWAKINSDGLSALSLNTSSIRLTGRDIMISGKRALVGMATSDGDVLNINYAKDYANGVRIEGDVGVSGPIKTNMWIECGKYDWNRTNDGEARFVAGATDQKGSSKIQIGSSTSSSFEIVNHTWNDSWFACSSSGIKSKSYANFSDVELKTNITSVPKISDKMDSINLYNYNYLSDFETDLITKNISLDPSVPDTRWGVIAQEVEKLFPELIVESEVLTGGEVKLVKSVDVYGLTCITLEYAKEIMEELKILKEKIGII